MNTAAQGLDLAAALAAAGRTPPGVLKLHLGCGEQRFDGYVNIDYPASGHNVMAVKPDIEADIATLRCEPATVGEIRLHHVFEHFSRVTAIGLLIRWRGWLEPGGRLEIETPDAMATAEAALAASPREAVALMRHIEGDQASSWAYHVGQWFPGRFERTLGALGFDDIRCAKSETSRYHRPPLHNVTVIARRGADVDEQALLQAADELLWDSTVADAETPTWQVWRAQLRDFLAGRDGGPAPLVAAATSHAPAQRGAAAEATARHLRRSLPRRLARRAISIAGAVWPRGGREMTAGAPSDSPAAQRPPAISLLRLDARHQRLTADYGIASKPAAVFPDAGARFRASIVIPCYNYGRYLPEAVESCLAQTLAGVEIVIVDNGSEDEHTIEVAKAFEGKGNPAGPPIKLKRLEPNRGLPGARNAGIEIAEGEYVCCLDADDVFEPSYVEKAVAMLEADRTLGFVHSWVQVFGQQDFVWETRDFDIETALGDNLTSVSAVFRRDDWEAAGRYDTRMHGGYDDWEFWLRLAALGRRGSVIREPLLRHRKHGANMTTSAHEKRAYWLRRMRDYNPAIFEDLRLRRLIAGLAPAPVAHGA